MKIFLVRHGEAESAARSDVERALTPHGQKQAALTAGWLKQQLEGADAIQLVCSSYRRARETAEIIGLALSQTPQQIDRITPEDDPRQALASIEAVLSQQGSQHIVVVSHMPLVAELTVWLTEGRLAVGRGFFPAEVRCLHAEILGVGMATQTHDFIPDLE
jgi:phosphohistidine phosphatase